MGLRDVVANAALAAFTAIDDLVETATYTQVAIGTYDRATDTQVETPTTFTIDGVLTREKNREDDKAVELNRLQFIVAALNMPVEPSLDDSLVILGIKYEINDIKHVPGRAIYTFFIRAT